MLRRSFTRFSLGGRAPTPFVNAALQLCQLHQEHRDLRGQISEGEASGAVMDERRLAMVQSELDGIEQEFMERLEHLRPIFHASQALASNRMYSAKIFNALRYFQNEDDPLFRELSRILGALRYTPGAKNSTTIWNESTASSSAGSERRRSHAASKQEIDDAVRDALSKVQGGKGSLAKTPEYGLSELPAPPPDEVGSEVMDDPAVPKFGFKDRGHWVLREPGIAASRNTRKLDPW